MMQFAEMLKIETSGTKFKYGTELPNVITEWLEEDFHEAFLLIKGQNYDKAHQRPGGEQCWQTVPEPGGGSLYPSTPAPAPV